MCAENFVRIDLVRESLNVGHDGRAGMLLFEAVGFAVQVEQPKSDWADSCVITIRRQRERGEARQMNFLTLREENGMSVNLEQEAVEIEGAPQNQEKIDLSRRTFLSRLTILGVGCAAAMMLGVTEADATYETDAAGGAKTPAEGEKAEFVENADPDDPLELSAQVRRRVARRRVRRTARRVVRRTGVRRRVYRRRVRRTARRVRRRRL